MNIPSIDDVETLAATQTEPPNPHASPTQPTASSARHIFIPLLSWPDVTTHVSTAASVRLKIFGLKNALLLQYIDPDHNMIAIWT